jgi:hypothetical protein
MPTSITIMNSGVALFITMDSRLSRVSVESMINRCSDIPVQHKCSDEYRDGHKYDADDEHWQREVRFDEHVRRSFEEREN